MVEVFMERDATIYREIEGNEIKKESNGSRLNKMKYKFIEVNKKEAEILGATAIIEFAAFNGFKNIISIKKIGERKPYIKRNEKLYVLTNSLEMDKFKLKTIEEGLCFAEVLAKFHRATEGYIPPQGIKLCVYWGRKMEKYRISLLRFEKYIEFLSNKKDLNDFEEYVMKCSGALLKTAITAMKRLKTLSYLKALENSMKNKEVCLNSISSNTAVIGERRVIVKDIYSIGYNMVEEDIGALIKRILEETGDENAFREIVDKYKENRELSDSSEEIIRALVSYPYEPIKIILKYNKKSKHIIEEGAQISFRMKEKLEKYIKKQLRTVVLEGD
jgi:CotS family spore coat protein